VSIRRQINVVGEDGSITVMIVFLIPVMLLVLMLIVNINTLFFQKIKLQNTVDACALSAAAVQAAGLNEIADLNQDMFNEHHNIKHILKRFPPWYSHGHAKRAKNYFYNHTSGVLDWIDRYQNEANILYWLKAEMVAQTVKHQNFPETTLIPRHRQGKLGLFHQESSGCSYHYYTATDGSLFPTTNPTRIWIDRPLPMFTGYHDGSFTIIAKRIVPVPGYDRIPYRKHKTSQVESDYEIRLPAQPFPVMDVLFRGMPALVAHAKAKPAGGSVAGLRPTYIAVLIE
jgi:hypothetical protein